MVHVRSLDGRSLRFGHRGWLWHNAFLLYDHGTDSLWHHQTGRALAGPLRGRALARLPTVLVPWAAFRAAHPGTRVLPKPPDPALREDPYATRTVVLELGLGLELDGRDVLYPLPEFGPDDVLHDVVGDVPVVLARLPNTRTATAFRAPDASVRLRLVRDDGGRALLEAPDGRAWNAVSGRPVRGTDALLAPLLATLWDRDAWERQHPRGRVHGAR